MVVTHDVEIGGLQYDSRKVQQGDIFVAIKGVSTDGHNHINAAVSSGARAIVMENDASLPDSFFMHAGVVKIVVGNSRRALAVMSANYFGHPAKQLQLIGVTGTNGKTTTTYLIKQLLELSRPSMQGKVGLIGTIEYMVGEEKYPATHTTPESLELHKLFATMVRKGCTHVVMEVSSHSLHQDRVYGLEFTAAVFTNLTQDHLDYHGTMENYFQAKKILFDNLPSSSWAITNNDDAAGLKIVQGTKASVLTYGVSGGPDVSANNVSLSIDGTTFVLRHHKEELNLHAHLVGRFNVYNILAACSAGIALGIPAPSINRGVASFSSVPGRFERILSPDGWSAIVDYAHTPDALEKCLTTIRDVLPAQGSNKIITVFGAGGDRDKTKRPAMGKVVDALSDVAVVTSDNPRTEDPTAIIDDVLKGIGRKNDLLIEPDRRRAITNALSMARGGDIVLIAGKGHEDYQIVGKTKHHFNDREVVQEFIKSALFMKLSLKDLEKLRPVEIINKEMLKNKKITGVSTDSRTIEPGNIFIALRGEKFDGHKFIEDAVKRNAAAVIVDAAWGKENRELSVQLRSTLVVVPDTTKALGNLANIYRRKFSLPVIAIGGSNGKTTTKEMISTVLRTTYSVLSTEGNLNNHIGVPQMLFRLTPQHDIAVLELGTNHFGEMKYLSDIVEPTHALVTNIGREHLEFFGDERGVAKEEMELFNAVAAKGFAFINADNAFLAKAKKKVRHSRKYGLSRNADVQARHVRVNERGQPSFELAVKKSVSEVCLSVTGLHNVPNALAAAAVGLKFKVPKKKLFLRLNNTPEPASGWKSLDAMVSQFLTTPIMPIPIPFLRR